MERHQLTAPAIRVRNLGRYFGPRVEFDGSARPREAWRTLLRIVGVEAKDLTDDNTQRTRVVAGHVLRDVSFDVEIGSVIALAGPSGCGKSVLLQILAGVIPPTSGRVELFGRVASLLTIGGNLDARTTALENIRTAAAELGVPDDRMTGFAADVIAFAELQGFENVALRTYSTGMTLRLSAALVLCSRPEIVLIDDVLAVGDIAFQQKCVDRVHELKDTGCTLLVAFSDEELVRQLATRVITLGGGSVVSDLPAHVTPQPVAAGGSGQLDWQVVRDLPEDDMMALRALTVVSLEDEQQHLDVTMEFAAKSGGLRCRPSVFVSRAKTVIYRSLAPGFIDIAAPGVVRWSVRIPTRLLPPANYSVMVNMQTLSGSSVYSIKAQDAVTLTIRPAGELSEAAPVTEKGAPVLQVDLPWEVQPVTAAA